jgi:alkyl hydroperoxide reductase subunit AhpC
MALQLGQTAPDFEAETTEGLRVLDSLQLTATHKVSTPVNWKQGEDVIISGSVSDDDAKKTYPQGWKAPRPYLRIVPQPKN